MTVKQKNLLNIFERKVVRTIVGPIREGNIWRRRSNAEIKEILEGGNIVATIKAARIRWAGHLWRMEDSRGVKKICQGNIEGRRSQGRPRKRWMDCVKDDLKKLGIRNGEIASSDRRRWRTIVESAKIHLGT